MFETLKYSFAFAYDGRTLIGAKRRGSVALHHAPHMSMDSHLTITKWENPLQRLHSVNILNAPEITALAIATRTADERITSIWWFEHACDPQRPDASKPTHVQSDMTNVASETIVTEETHLTRVQSSLRDWTSSHGLPLAATTASPELQKCTDAVLVCDKLSH